MIDFVLNFYEKCPERSNSDYTKRTTGEIPSQYFPHFPLIFERPKYTADNSTGENDDLCTKLFPEHVKLSPGLFLVTCACTEKKYMDFS